jgi:guanidinoacetate N-methyltransferase
MGENNFKKWNDVRDLTFQERLKIGFNEVSKKWQSAAADFTEDKLTICGHPVMERWEDNYMRMLAEIATRNGGTILEVGFGLGISAFYIQNQKIKKHIIIEANRDVYEKACEFSRKMSSEIELILGFWEDTIFRLSDESIDGILFDTYPLEIEEVHCNHFNFFDEAYRLLKPNGVLTYYSDEISDFSKGHVDLLQQSGFAKIQSKICQVAPPPDCQYWRSNTILAPIIIK